MAEPHLLMVLVDALRHDQVDAVRMPFLHEMARAGSCGATQEAFAGQLRPAFFAGLWPNESKVGHLFCYDPLSSPFKAARFVPSWVDRWPHLAWWVRRGVVASARRTEARRGHRGSASYCYLAEIPTRRLPLFAFSEKTLPWEDRGLPRPGLLDILSAQGMPWLHLAYPVIDQRTAFLTSAALSRIRAAHRFVFIHYAQLDWTGHEHGPEGDHASSTAAAIDDSLRTVWHHAASLWPNPKLLVFGDHGMVTVRGAVDVEDALQALPLRHGRDYAVFLDSTVARFWFLGEKARTPITERLAGLRGGRWLTEEDLEELHLRGGARENGEAFWLLDDGLVIMPSYFQRTVRPAGMHGYHPSVRDNWGALVTSDDSAPRQAVPLTDVFPLALRILGLETLTVLP